MTIKAMLPSLDGVDDATKAFYAKDGDNYLLDAGKYAASVVEKETAGLKSKLDELLDETKKAKAKAKEEQNAAVRAAEEAARKAGDVDAIEKSWSAKYEKDLGEARGEAEALRAMVGKLTAGSAAKGIAAEMAIKGSETVLEQILSPRLKTEFKDGEARVVVLDRDGKPSASTLDDLRKEISGDAALKPILSGTNGSGGGAAGASGGGGGAAPKGSFGGSREERTAAIRAKFPDLNKG